MTLYAEPGKHAFHATPDPIRVKRQWLEACCGPLTSEGHVLVNAMFEAAFAGITAEDHRAVRRHLQGRAFLPSFNFDRRFDLAMLDRLSWPELHGYIAARVPAVLAEVRRGQPLLKAVLLDSGDTLVDEATEIRDAQGYVVEAALIPAPSRWSSGSPPRAIGWCWSPTASRRASRRSSAGTACGRTSKPRSSPRCWPAKSPTGACSMPRSPPSASPPSMPAKW